MATSWIEKAIKWWFVEMKEKLIIMIEAFISHNMMNSVSSLLMWLDAGIVELKMMWNETSAQHYYQTIHIFTINIKEFFLFLDARSVCVVIHEFLYSLIEWMQKIISLMRLWILIFLFFVFSQIFLLFDSFFFIE